MNLVIDFGNTLTKVGIFEKDKLIRFQSFKNLFISDLDSFFSEYSIKKSILSSVINHAKEIENYLKRNSIFIDLNLMAQLPIINKYETPKTLGQDRLINAIAGASVFPNSNILVIDAGTCIKFDFINSQKEYLGGHISPGLQMRFNALHSNTAKLPMYKVADYKKLIGINTEESIKTGVLTASLAEVEGMIAKYISEFKDLKIIVTGGDVSFFEQNLKYSIFADSNLLLKGLNQIIRYD